MNPEVSHAVALLGLELTYRLGWRSIPEKNENTVMGLRFANRVGLAAGFDKNGRHVDALMSLGFGHIEIGTVTPRPQPGNPKPRLFRLAGTQALINRMGFNNDGIDSAIAHLKHTQYDGIIGISIGKNAATPLEAAAEDYIYGLQRAYPYAGYVALNISSPGTKDLRCLQKPESLDPLVTRLKKEQHKLLLEYGKYVPLVIKLSPDIEDSELDDICRILISRGMDGIIASNTTISRKGVEECSHAGEDGGLSGAPLSGKAAKMVFLINQYVAGKIPIIASGGIMGVEDAIERFNAGASLVQVYTGLVYHGPGIIKAIAGLYPEPRVSLFSH